MLNVIMLAVLMLDVENNPFMLNAVMLSVVWPLQSLVLFIILKSEVQPQ